MTSRERRGKWLFFVLTAVVMIGPLLGIFLSVMADPKQWHAPLWWLGVGVGFASPIMLTQWKLRVFSSWSWIRFFVIVGLVLVVDTLLPGGTDFGFEAALPVLIVYLWLRRSEALRTWVVVTGLICGIGQLVVAGPMAVHYLVSEPFVLATYIPVSFAAVGLLGIGAAVTISRSSAVRAFLRYHFTEMSEGPDEKPGSTGLLSGGCIFISYRQAESRHVVGRMYDDLVKAVGEDKVFVDTQNIPIGTLFQEELERRLGQASIMLVVIGPAWVGATDGTGQRRLDNPEDFVRLEIRNAIKQAVPLIPVLFDGAHVPKLDELPEDIAKLVKYKAFDLRSDPDFHPSMDRLIEQIRRPGPDGPAGHRVTQTVLFELRSDLPYDPDPYDPGRQKDVIWAQDVNEKLLAAVGARPLRVVGWSGRPYRVQCEADQKTFELLQTALKSQVLDRVTGVRWEAVDLVDNVRLASQLPLALCEGYKEDAEPEGLICHLSYIKGFLREAEEAEKFVGKPTRDSEQVRVYITKKWFLFITFTYVHSNYIKPGREWPTKIITNSWISLFTIFTNLLFDHRMNADLIERTNDLHQHRVQYFVNERKFPKGDVAFFCGAEKIRWVWVRSRFWWWPF